MDFLHDLLLNYYFLTFIAAWVSSTFLKAFLHSWKHNVKFHIKYGFQNGGMPSGHTTIVSALTFSLLFKMGLSDLFYASAIFASIVIIDAVRVRKNIGMQGDKLNVLLKEFNEKPVEIVYGHSFTQVLGGILLGLLCAFIFKLILF
jgi:acid phosphatase family membrane protein YuiD